MIRTSPLSTFSALALLAATAGCGTTAPPSDPKPGVDPTAKSATAAPTVAATAAPTSVVTTAPTASAAPVAQKPGAVDACRATVADVPGDKAAKRAFDCPKDCGGSSWVWGDVVYTEDSYVCVAAIHAGAITAATGGKVFVEPLPGRPQYFGSARNGVISGNWSSFAGSIRIHAVGADGKPKEIPIPPAPATTTITSQPAPPECSTSARTLVATGTSATMTCPAGCDREWVYGSGPYTDDSSVCSAAIHAGVIPASGGAIRVTLGPKQGNHQASTKNGVTARAWSSEYVTFTVTKP